MTKGSTPPNENSTIDSLEHLSDDQFKSLAKENKLTPFMDPEFVLAWVQGRNPAKEEPKKKTPTKRTKSSSSSRKRSSNAKMSMGKIDGVECCYTEELCKMMHCFGDASNPQIETAQMLELLSKDYVTRLFNNIMEANEINLPSSTESNKSKKRKTGNNTNTKNKNNFNDQNAKIKLTADMIANALPDQSKRHRVFEIMDFLKRSKNLEKAGSVGLFDDEDGTEFGLPSSKSANHMEGMEDEHNENEIETSIPEILDVLLADNHFEKTTSTSNVTSSSSHPDSSSSPSKNNFPAKKSSNETACMNTVQERLLRREAITRELTQEEYLYYAECSKVSFIRPCKRKKFVEWIQIKQFPLLFDFDVIDVIGQLVYEHAEELVWKAKLKLLIETMSFAGLTIPADGFTKTKLNDEAISMLMACRPLTDEEIENVVSDQTL